MKKTLLALVILGLGIASCSKEPQPLSKQQIRQKVDSITQVRTKEADIQAQQDLEHRIKIEVKVKVDSIVYARTHPVATPTVNAAPKPGTPFKGVIPHLAGKRQ